MGDITTFSTGSSIQPGAPLGSCRYCGAPLAPGYYFCLNCATPYATVESVLPPVYIAPPTESEQIERRAPHAWPMFWTYVGVLLVTGILNFLAFGEEQIGYAIFLSSAAMLVTTFIFAAMHWPSLAVQLRRVGFTHPAAWIGLAALVPMLALNYGYQEIFLKWLVPMKDPMDNIRGVLGDGGAVMFICILPAIVEEIAFRGLLQHWLQIAIRPMRAVILASLLFGALHGSVISLPYLFLVGMLLGMVKLKTGSLYPSMLIHFLHNLAVVELFSRL